MAILHGALLLNSAQVTLAPTENPALTADAWSGPSWVPDWPPGINNYTFLGNGAWQWVIALLVAAATYFAARFALRFTRARLGRIAEGRAHRVLDFVRAMFGSVMAVFVIAMSLAAGAQALTLAPPVEKVLRWIVVIIAALQLAALSIAVFRVSTRLFVEVQTAERPERADSLRTTLGAVNALGTLAISVLVGLLAMQNLGIEVMPLIAGLGIGGIAIALAVQSVLGDIFASVSIVLDQPFIVGDFIIVGDQMGTVERIGLKTTRVRSLGGELLIFSNTDLLQSRIRNYKHMAERRVVFSLGVVYQTPPEQLDRIGPMIRELIVRMEGVRFDRAHFKQFGPSSLDYEVVYYVLSPDYNRYMDIQQAMNIAIARRFIAEQIEFAYPTQTLFLQQQAPPAPPDHGSGTDESSAPTGRAAPGRSKAKH